MRRHLLSLALLLGLAVPAQAQDSPPDLATLVADQIEIQADSVLVAAGNVEVLQKGMRLKASRVTFDQKTDKLKIEGPIVLTDATGTRIVADQADLSSSLTDGILTGARLVLKDQLQLASNYAMRAGGRYTELGRTVASSCQICKGSQTPLWEIRASRVVHDKETRQIYFEDANLRLFGVPVAYIPRLRMPDPTLERARGWLLPSIRSTSQLGFGIMAPYFVPIGENRDLTITPYISTNDAQTLGLRYRQAFWNGYFQAEGAVSRDQIDPGTRGYLFANGYFGLPDSFTLSFGLQMASDNSYLQDYGISSQDRLDSFIQVERVKRDNYIYAGLTHLASLRDEDSSDTQPSTLVNVIYDQRFAPPVIGGAASLRYEATGSMTASSSTVDSNGDGNSDGQDTARGLVRLDWRRDWVLANGFVAAATGRVLGDVTFVGQDPAYPSAIERAYGVFGTELRYPMVKSDAWGGTQLLQPVVNVLFSKSSLPTVPDNDSLVVELDEGNLLSLDRFPGTDKIELGTRGAMGLDWTRYARDGSEVELAFGRVLRADDLDQFTPSSGLDGAWSNWLLAMRVASWKGLTLTQRVLLDDQFDANMGEFRMNWGNNKVGLESGYYWGIADDEADRPNDVSEVSFNSSWKMNDNWSSVLGIRHDFIAGRTSDASLGFVYRNECMLVDLSVSRWYADSTSLNPTTEFGLKVELLGFGGGSAPGPARQCRG